MVSSIEQTETESTSCTEKEWSLYLKRFGSVWLYYKDLNIREPEIFSLVRESVIQSYPEHCLLIECSIDHEEISGKFIFLDGMARLLIDVTPSGNTTLQQLYAFAEMYVHQESVEEAKQYLTAQEGRNENA
ncbi:hypothetical protein J2Y86_000898 [Pseudomonas migulae]|uniref:hypothetical protein n=1 Tax=Pseudomonas migulae TaxID=78543 RepID=UPI00209F4B73|nr:hypothetical protein [Pseudomonas migulae]MCP1496191.1 hypothetical protein [Pseudomonas migulae]